MGDHDDRLSQFVDRPTQEAQDLRAGDGIQVAGRFVGEDELGACDQRAGDGDALLLAAGQLVRAVVQALLEPQRGHEQVEPGAVRFLAGQRQRHDDVLLGGEHRQQVEALEDEADLVAAQHGQLVVGHGGDVGAVEHDVPAGGGVESGERVHQCGFAGAGRPHDGGEPPLFERHVHAAQRMDGVLAVSVILDQVDGLDGSVHVAPLGCPEPGSIPAVAPKISPVRGRHTSCAGRNRGVAVIPGDDGDA